MISSLNGESMLDKPYPFTKYILGWFKKDCQQNCITFFSLYLFIKLSAHKQFLIAMPEAKPAPCVTFSCLNWYFYEMHTYCEKYISEKLDIS